MGEILAETGTKAEAQTLWPWLVALLAWAVPGAGHLSLGRMWRALLLGGAVWAMFFFGVYWGGHLYGVLNSGAGMLSYVFGLLDLGTGLLYVFCWNAGIAVVDQARLQTAEYGNVFLMVAGLINYLLVLDAFDIAARRKP